MQVSFLVTFGVKDVGSIPAHPIIINVNTMVTIGSATISDVIALCLKRYPERFFYEKGHGLVKIVEHHIWGRLFYMVDVIRQIDMHGTTKWHFHHEMIKI